jgi:hypothetical protein
VTFVSISNSHYLNLIQPSDMKADLPIRLVPSRNAPRL